MALNHVRIQEIAEQALRTNCLRRYATIVNMVSEASTSSQHLDFHVHVPDSKKFVAHVKPTVLESLILTPTTPLHKSDAEALFEKHAERKIKAVIDPFRPYDSELFVTKVLENSYALLLNKFQVFTNHFLIVTSDFEPQTNHLSLRDFRAVYEVIERLGDDYLFFYNRGHLSGASQPHKHIQLVRFCNDDGTIRFPLLPHLLANGSIQLPIRHFLHFFEESDSEGSAERAHDVYMRALREMNVWEESQHEEDDRHKVEVVSTDMNSGEEEHHVVNFNVASYNFLFCTKFLFVVPRRREHFYGLMSCNSLSFVHCLYCKSEEVRCQIDSYSKVLRYLTFPESQNEENEEEM